MQKDDRIYLLFIQECIRRVEENSALGLEAFRTSHTLQDATLRNLQTMTQATQRLSEALRSQFPDVEWQRLGAFRNILVHGYLGIDLDRVWEIVQGDVPHLKHVVLRMLESIGTPKET